ncbi:kynureninase [Phenylobacterium sp.]|uniref:kynureninase n=1 Tax=Phenylobacterium sp. TaxID=1871053 RepID=UPI0035B2B359
MTRDDARALDAQDPLARFRDAFDLPPGMIYLDGNSLGPPPKTALAGLRDAAERQWGRDLITSWNVNGWIDAPLRVGGKIAGLLGARPHEVAVADSTSVNLFKLAAGALGLRPGRRVILSETGNFPTDLYVLEGLARTAGAELRAVHPDRLLDALNEDVAVLVLTHVHYRTARRWDMAALTAAAHAKGALVLWDLSHSAGAVAVDLNDCGADLAVGCGYKYLNGGPGAPAFLFVAERHLGAIRSPLSGWMGHAEPFAFEHGYRPSGDIRAQLCGTPGVLGLAALEASIDLQVQADPAAIEAKGQSLCDLFIAETDSRCGRFGVELATPRAARERGLHVSFAHPQGYAVVQALIARGVVGDYRSPDLMRFGFSPLYLSHAEVWDAVAILEEVLATGAWDRPEFRARAAVT